MKKLDVQLHADNNQPARPAINIKIHTLRYDIAFPLELETPWKTTYTDPRFTWDWIDEHVPDADGTWFSLACQEGFEQASDYAKNLFGPHIKVFQTGRSGGWLEVEGLSPVGSWSASTLAKWASLEKRCKQLVGRVVQNMVELIYFDAFEPWIEQQEREHQQEMILNLR